MSTNALVLHILPAKWGLPSMDPSCLATVMYLQKAIPGQFAVVECTVQDQSPTGQLPFLTHNQRTVSSLGPIIRYVASLKVTEKTRKDSAIIMDATLDSVERSQTTAWCTHIESNLGDIVYHVLYSHQTNWAELMHPALASMYPVPQRYYIPLRMRQSYKPRLEAVGLWNIAVIEEDDNKPFKGLRAKRTGENKKAFQQAFGREKVIEKARTSLELYSRLIGERSFIFRERPTRLDIVLAAHVLLLLDLPYPDPFLHNFIKDAFPNIAQHARRVYNQVFDPSEAPLQTSPAPSFSWSSLIFWPAFTRNEVKESKDDVHFTRMRWGFYGLALGSLAVYLTSVLAVTKLKVALVREGESSTEGEER